MLRKVIAIIPAVLLNGIVLLWLNQWVGGHVIDILKGQTRASAAAPKVGWPGAPLPAGRPPQSRRPAGEAGGAYADDHCIAAVLMPYCALANPTRVRHRG